MKINYNKLKVIFAWIMVALSAFFILGTLAAIKRWIDRSWAEGIAEYSVILIFAWIMVALSAFFILGTLAAIKRWIDRSWAEGIAEYSVILIFVLGAVLIVCFLLDRPDDEKKEKEAGRRAKRIRLIWKILNRTLSGPRRIWKIFNRTLPDR